MPAKKTKPGYAFVVEFLKRRPKASFQEVRKAAAKKGHKIYPIVFGRAKAQLGLVPTTPKRAKVPDAVSDLENAIAAMKDREAELHRYRDALARIRAIIDDVLE